MLCVNKDHDSGAGLGLIIAQKFVQAMGGRIDVASVPGDGTTFSFSIDVDLIPRQEPHVIKRRSSSILSRSLADYKLRIMVCEDNVINMRIMNKLLAAIGCSPIDTAKDGRTALALATTIRYDVVFMDVSLPDMSGMDVTLGIRNCKNVAD